MIFQTVLKVKRLLPVAFSTLPLLLVALPVVAYHTEQADLAYALKKQENKPVVKKEKNEGTVEVISESEESAVIDSVGQVQILDDGTIILPDGTKLLPDGTQILPNGEELEPIEPVN